MYACRNVILADVKKKREKEEGGGEEEAVGRLLHSKLRMQWYAEAGLLTKKGPTPKEPHCFEGTVSIGCLFYKHNTDKGFYHGYYRTYATLLEEYREKERVNLLEIGVKDGESMNSWIEYFEGEGEGGGGGRESWSRTGSPTVANSFGRSSPPLLLGKVRVSSGLVTGKVRAAMRETCCGKGRGKGFGCAGSVRCQMSWYGFSLPRSSPQDG
jgi:hypothetical protein